MKIKRNGKIIGNVDMRFNDLKTVKGKDPRINSRKRLRTPRRGKQSQRIAKIIVALLIVPTIAMFFTAMTESFQSTPKEAPQAEEIPPAIRFDELSVVNKVTDHAEAHAEKKESIEDMIKRIFPEDWELATAIFKAESGLNPNAKGDTNTAYPSIGVAQIRMLPERGLNEQDLYNAEYNLQYARHLKDLHGWKIWSAFSTGKYKQFIK